MLVDKLTEAFTADFINNKLKKISLKVWMIKFQNLAWALDDPSFVNSPLKMDVAHWIWSLNEQDFKLLQFWIFASIWLKNDKKFDW